MPLQRLLAAFLVCSLPRWVCTALLLLLLLVPGCCLAAADSVARAVAEEDWDGVLTATGEGLAGQAASETPQPASPIGSLIAVAALLVACAWSVR